MFGDELYESEGGDASVMDPAEELRGDGTSASNEADYDTSYSPPEREPAAVRGGITASEQQQGESLDQRLSEEEPDVSEQDAADDVSDPRAGRLVAPDEGAHGDTEADSVAADAGISGGAASSEEAAMHVVDPDERP